MSDIQIEIVTKTITQPEGKKYKQMEVIYKNLSFQGKVENKKIIDFYAKEIWPTLEDAKQGDVFTISRAKEGEYWQWKGITVGKSGQTPASTTQSSSGGNTNGRSYVADDVKQVMIIRQSSIASAVNLLRDRSDHDETDVLDVARKFEAYVLGKDTEPAKPASKAALPEELNDDMSDLPY